jgi:hypothetical protein
MAKVLYGAGISQMVNRLGDMVFYRGPHGDVSRAFVNPNQTETAPRTNARAAWTQARQYWLTTLTDAQRQAWEIAASQLNLPGKLSNVRHLSGWQLYLQHAMTMVFYAEATPPTLPPTSRLIPQPTALTVTAQATGTPNITITWSFIGSSPTPAPQLLVAMQSGLLTLPGRKCYPLAWRYFRGNIITNSPDPAAYDDWHYQFGPLTTGQRLHIRARLVDTTNGLHTPWIRTNCLVS